MRKNGNQLSPLGKGLIVAVCICCLIALFLTENENIATQQPADSRFKLPSNIKQMGNYNLSPNGRLIAVPIQSDTGKTGVAMWDIRTTSLSLVYSPKTCPSAQINSVHVNNLGILLMTLQLEDPQQEHIGFAFKGEPRARILDIEYSEVLSLVPNQRAFIARINEVNNEEHKNVFFKYMLKEGKMIILCKMNRTKSHSLAGGIL